MDGITLWAKQSPLDQFWFYTGPLLVVAVISFVYAYKFFYRKRLIEDTPTSKIRSAAQGYVELSGLAQLMEGPTIVAPLSGKPCTWHRFSVEEKRGSGKNSSWVTVNKGVSDELFLLKDDTGECVIDPEGARVTASVKQTWYGSSANPGRLMGSTGNKTSLFSTGSLLQKYRYTEERLNVNCTLYAIGLFRSEGGAAGHMDFNEDVRELLREWKQDSQRMLNEFDSNKDGHIDMEEWETAREAAYKMVKERHADEKVSLPTQMMVQTRDQRRPYILSAKAESDLLKHLNIYFYGLASSTFITSALAFWFLSIRLAG